jgi:hypothetical protein
MMMSSSRGGAERPRFGKWKVETMTLTDYIFIKTLQQVTMSWLLFLSLILACHSQEVSVSWLSQGPNKIVDVFATENLEST